MTSLAWRGDPADLVIGSDPDAVGEWMLQLVEAARPGWHVDAACAGVDLVVFFPPSGRVPVDAYEICGRCLVQSDCLAEALADPELDHGVRGGLSAGARKKLRRSTVAGRPQGGSDHGSLGAGPDTPPLSESLSLRSGTPPTPGEEPSSETDLCDREAS